MLEFIVLGTIPGTNITLNFNDVVLIGGILFLIGGARMIERVIARRKSQVRAHKEVDFSIAIA